MKHTIVSVLMLLVATTMSGQKRLNGDLNHDGKIDISDVTAIVNVALGKSQAEVIKVDPDPHDYVDLGLPSGTLWATCNIGATNPEDFGDYFAWGEVEPKNEFTWDSYYYNIEDNINDYDYNSEYPHRLTRYCNNSNYGYEGFTDTLTILKVVDDAATVNWGIFYCMPTENQLEELRNKCTWTWTQLNGVNGHEVVGPNGNSIFLPAAGYRAGTDLCDAGSWGYYWSRNLLELPNIQNPYYAHYLCFLSASAVSGSQPRYYGYSVRAVRNR